MPPLTRRAFVRGSLWLVCATPAAEWLQGCSAPQGSNDAGTGDASTPFPVPPGLHLSGPRYLTLSAMMDALLPPEGSFVGAVAAGAPWYLDQLLGAFDVDPPRIYAGGPYSGRHGGEASFARFQRLTRVEELRWRTYLEGSRGIAAREWNGPVVGLQTQYERGLDAIESLAQQRFTTSFASLGRNQRRTLLASADATFRQTVYEHAVEGVYGDPVYGGNQGNAGWDAIAFEGDRQPIGYTARQMARPEEG